MDPKCRPLSKKETEVLLSLVEASTIIIDKKTNATSNAQKVEEWKKITKQFNATVGQYLRTPQQLRLKWENLKKSARKRTRMKLIKAGGGTPEYIPQDDVLDRVNALLSTTVQRLSADFGGDSEEQMTELEDNSIDASSVLSTTFISLETPFVVKEDFAMQMPEESTPIASGTRQRRNDEIGKARIKKDLAIAKYFETKTKYFEMKMEFMKKNNFNHIIP